MIMPKAVRMKRRPIHQCPCGECQRPDANPIKELHTRMNLFLSVLDERQRRLYAGMESERIGHGGDRQIARMTGLSVDTIAKGRRELERQKDYERIRALGGGRIRVEKKTRTLLQR